MLWVVALLLFILWLFGMVAGKIYNGLIFLLLVAAVVLVVLQLIRKARSI